jgi:hypothetical protein
VGLRTRLTPYILLGTLTLGTGLGIGLGLSEAPAARPPTFVFGKSQPETCFVFSTPTEVGFTCTSSGAASSGLGIRATFTTHIHTPKGQSPCVVRRTPIGTGPGSIRKAIAFLKSRCFGG